MSNPPVTTLTPIDPFLLDALFECYLDWKEACFEVREAYARWRQAVFGDRTTAFAAYTVALDVEENASDGYAELVAARDGRSVTGRPISTARTAAGGGG
jgi:hypothetical protein